MTAMTATIPNTRPNAAFRAALEDAGKIQKKTGTDLLFKGYYSDVH